MKLFLSRRWRPFLVLTLLVLFLGMAAMPALASSGELAGLDLVKKGGNGRGNAFGHGNSPVWRDVPADYWAWACISKMGAKGVLKGYGNGLFCPLNNVTRLELVIMATRLLGYEEEALALTPAEVAATLKVFKDYPSFPIWPGVLDELAYAQQEGYLWPLMQGRSDQTFRPYSPATRLEVVVVLLEAMGRGHEAKAMASAPINFKDAASVPAWAHGYVALAIKLGMLKGDKGSLNLARPVNRAEVAALLDRADSRADTPLDREVITGAVVRVTIGSGSTPSAITIVPGADPETLGEGEVTYDLAGSVVVMNDDRQGDLEDVAEGDFVALYFDEKGLVLLIDIREAHSDDDGDDGGDQETAEVTGTVSAVHEGGSPADPSTISIVKDADASGSGHEVTYIVAADADITVNGKDAELDEVKVGSEVTLTLDRDKEVVAIDETYAVSSALGTIAGKAVDSHGNLVSLTIRTGSRTVTYAVSPDAEILAGGEEIEASDLSVGDVVRLQISHGSVIRITVE